MLLSVTDFASRPYKIPNQNESADLSAFIEDAEEQILTDLLGYEFYNTFATNYDTSGTPAQKWIDLAEGAEYTYNDVTYNWKGLVDLLKPIVYARWMDIGAYKFTNVGWIQNSAQENSTLIDSEQFRVQYVNEYAKKAGINYNMYNTLWGFLEVNKAEYEDYNLEWSEPFTENRLGL